MYKQFLIIVIIYFSGLIANEAKIDTTLTLVEKLVALQEASTFDEFFEKAIQSKLNKLLNPESFLLIVKLNSNKVDTFSFSIDMEDDGTIVPHSINSNLTSEQIKIKVYIEESVYNDEIHKSVVQIIKSTEPGLRECDDCIEIESIKKIMDEKSTISLNREDIYDDSWAVIIGIDKYKYSDQLNYAVKDAEAVKDMLINKFDYPEENIRYLTDEEATLSEIKLALDDISTTAGENDRILIFYSGHGETLKGADGSEKGYIIPYGGRQDKPYATGFAMDEILTTSQMSKSKHMLFLMDACYSGLMTEKAKGLSQPQEEGYLSKVANEKARQIITAGGRDEQVIERDEWQHSAFTKNLLAGLDDWDADTDSDGYITADELGTYLRKSVTEDSDFQQTPQKGRFRNSGGGEFVFFSDSGSESKRVQTSIIDNEDKNIEEKNQRYPFNSFWKERKLRFQVNFKDNDPSEADSETSYIIGISFPVNNLLIDNFMIGYHLYYEYGTFYNYNWGGLCIEGDRYINDNLFLYSRLSVVLQRYNFNNNSNETISTSPILGVGYPTKYITFTVGSGWTFSDLEDEYGALLNEGLYLELGLVFHVN